MTSQVGSFKGKTQAAREFVCERGSDSSFNGGGDENSVGRKSEGVKEGGREGGCTCQGKCGAIRNRGGIRAAKMPIMLRDQCSEQTFVHEEDEF